MREPKDTLDRSHLTGSPRRGTRWRSFLSWLGVTLLLSALLLTLIEGGASLFLFVWDAVKPVSTIAEELSTVYDPELGWVAEPNLDSPDFYGPGRRLRTEARGFRSDYDIMDEPSDRPVRAICSGDSFTLGYGVADEDVWCELVGGLLDIETVNMGQGGYGVDQALWYMRDGAALTHQLHLFAFIETDFDRTGQDRFLGIPKPLMKVVDGELEVTNLPVPRLSAVDRARDRIFAVAGDLRLHRFFRGIGKRIGRRRAETMDPDSATAEVVARLFASLSATNTEKSSQFVLVSLPTIGSHRRVEPSFWQTRVSELADSLGIPLIDLVPNLQALPGSAVDALFIPDGVVQFRLSAGHYTAEGNRWIAEQLAEELRRMPQTTARLPGSGTHP